MDYTDRSPKAMQQMLVALEPHEFAGMSLDGSLAVNRFRGAGVNRTMPVPLFRISNQKPSVAVLLP